MSKFDFAANTSPKGLSQKSFYPQKNSSVTSCHLFLPLPEGKYPEGGMGRENRGGAGDSFRRKGVFQLSLCL